MTRPLTALAALIALTTALPAHAGNAFEVAGASRFVGGMEQAEARARAAYGPFRVLDESTVALVDVTDRASPAQFAALLRAFPNVRVLRFHDCPGTEDDVANLQLGRMIRAAHLAVEVPDGSSVRSGAVELVLAGEQLAIADGAEFAVHGWIDEDGLGAQDYPADSPEHQRYLAYYRDMGMAAGQAQAFYAMTNSVPFEAARWLTGTEMRGWVQGAEAAAPQAEPMLAYLDLALVVH